MIAGFDTGVVERPPVVRRRPTRAARIGIALTVFAAFLLVASAGYRLLQPEYTWSDALYMTVISVATVGYGEVRPLSGWSRLWTILVIAGGLVLVGTIVSMIGSMVIEGQVRKILGRRQLQRKIAALSGHVIVCGYGRMGSVVARELSAAGREIVVVDSDTERTTAAEQAGLLYVLGDAQEEQVLCEAGVERAADLLAALPDDADNAFVTLSARQLSPSLRIVARTQYATSQNKLLLAGATRVVCPDAIGATRMSQVVLRPALVDFVEMAHGGVNLEAYQLPLEGGSRLIGKTLAELGLRQRIGATVVAVRPADGEPVYLPGGDLKLSAGDTLILIGGPGTAEAVQEFEPEAT